VIPARDEALRITAALEALAAQRDLAGLPLPTGTFDVVVLANGCTDATVDIVRTFARRNDAPPTTVLEATAPQIANVGAARRVLMDAAATRFMAAGRPRGWIASTDADSRVDRRWVALTLAQHDCDAVMGRIVVDPRERAHLDAAETRLFVSEMAYRRAVAQLEAVRDPVPHDPAPRHGHRYGASLAVRAETYLRTDGMPEIPQREDLGFYTRLTSIDARVRHHLGVRVTTSLRTSPFVEGGFGSFIDDVRSATRSRRPWFVQHPQETRARIEARAALRRYAHTLTPADARSVAEHFALDAAAIETLFDCEEPFGANYLRFEQSANERRIYRNYAPVELEAAVRELRQLAAARLHAAIAIG
jgi:glycosyltransferase involved in cell wall biosynthesis